MYKAFSYMAYAASAVCFVASFYAHPYVYLPAAAGLVYLGYYLRSKV